LSGRTVLVLFCFDVLNTRLGPFSFPPGAVVAGEGPTAKFEINKKIKNILLLFKTEREEDGDDAGDEPDSTAAATCFLFVLVCFSS